MATITGAIGQGGANHVEDVRLVQGLLNQQAARIGVRPLPVDGRWSPALGEAIGAFQRAVLGSRAPNGQIAPGDRTMRSLTAGGVAADATEQAQAVRQRARLSGAAWFRANAARYPNSAAIADLTPAFAAAVRSFVKAVEDAGAHVHVSSTRRNPVRAYLMHWAWKVAHGTVKADKVPANPAVDIDWDHGTDKASRAAAQQMVDLFQIKYQPSLTSNHIKGTAIDMTITWSAAITVTDAGGKQVAVDKPRNGNDNATLHTIGAGYGVTKLLADPPHWSADGH